MLKHLPSNVKLYTVAEYPDLKWTRKQLHKHFAAKIDRPVRANTFNVRLSKHGEQHLSEATVIKLLTRVKTRTEPYKIKNKDQDKPVVREVKKASYIPKTVSTNLW